MISIDPEQIAALIREVAATEIMPRFQKLAAHEIEEKRPGNLVTAADFAAEAALERAFGGLTPGAAVVGEEQAEKDPESLRPLLHDGPVWIIDPVDGTANFAAGKPVFAVMVALQSRGETVMGWIFEPVDDRMIMAERGSGATKNGTRLTLAPAPVLAEQTGYLPRRLRKMDQIAERFAALPESRRCVGADYSALARSEAHFGHYRQLNPWDHAPGALIHSEAGGWNACLDGTPYRPGAPGEGGLLLAPDPDLWEALRASIETAQD